MSDSIFAIAGSGMDVERQRMQVIAQNLANASTTRTASGAPYQPMRLVSGPRIQNPTTPDGSFATTLSNLSPTQINQTNTQLVNVSGVQAYGVEPMNTQPHLVYDPSHPHADAKGFVSYPGLDHAGEMALMVQTQRVYEADVVMFNAARSMYMRALDLGGR